MKPIPQVGDIWKWTSEGDNITYVLLLELQDESHKNYENWDKHDIRFTCLQIYGEGWHARETGDIDSWDFGESVDYGWEFVC